MSLHVVTAKSGIEKARVTRSPRIAILTDAASLELVPAEIRRAAELISTEDVGVLQGVEVPAEADGALLWLKADRLLCGTPADLRAVFLTAGVETMFVPVHRPGLPEADLIGIEPRMQRRGPGAEVWSPHLRLFQADVPSPRARTALRHNPAAWARLTSALLLEKDAERAVQLKMMWQTPGLEPRFRALVLRNLIVVLIRQRNYELAKELATGGMDAFPGCAEMCFLAAVLAVYRQEPWKAVSLLEKAMSRDGRGYLGSGGENSYRAACLLGRICALAGEQEKALNYFLPGIGQRPAFRPSVEGILSLRLPRNVAAQLHQDLCLVARREPEYLAPVFEFYLRHRVFGPPRRLLRVLPLAEQDRSILEERLSAAEAFLRPQAAGRVEKMGVTLSGPLLIHSGHARINRALARHLAASPELEIRLEPVGLSTCSVNEVGGVPALAEGLDRVPSRLDLTIRHQWPPDFRRPETGKLACILPWEYCAVPRKWVEAIERTVDELWVPSEFVARAFREGGVDAARVHVVPNGVDPEIFASAGECWRPLGCRKFAFLFVGGTIRRKGVDLLLEAYADGFGPEEEVTLVIKDLGSRSFYSHNNLIQKVAQFARRPEKPHVVVVTEELPDARLAALYRGCDALVHPYRAEGFGMPLLEAMACGKPVITSECGPATEFCTRETAYLVPTRQVKVPEQPPPLGELTAEWRWFEPDLGALVEAMRRVYEERKEATGRGQRAAERIRATHSWACIAKLYRERILSLCGAGAHPEEALAGPAKG